jgi:YesN/AraC family two-component response regulator
MYKIQVVDDESIVAMGLEKRLTKMGFEVVGTASSGVEAIEKARELRPDLILMDIAMPGEIDGIDAADLIKSEMDIPIIFLTAYADTKLINRAKMIDPVGYIVKPYKEEELQAAIVVALHKKEKEAIYRLSQKKKDRKLIAALREQSEKLKELETKIRQT